MADIFISCAGPDRLTVESIEKRLGALGLKCFVYYRDIGAGTDWRQTINDEIKASSLGVIMLSPDASQREWILNEIGILQGARKEIIAVRIATNVQIPDSIANLNVQDLSPGAGFEVRLSAFIPAVFRKLKKPLPISVYCALFAMTSSQLPDVRANLAASKFVAEVSANAGIPEERLWQMISARYQPTVETFAPFRPGESLCDLVAEEVKLTNEWRKRPMHVHWCHEDLMRKDETLGNKWMDENSILIVDSLSAYHPAIRDVLNWLPTGVVQSQPALFWVPPYSAILTAIEPGFVTATRETYRIRDAFRTWNEWSTPGPLRQSPKRWMSFDTGTRGGFADWMHRVAVGQPEGDMALRNKANQMSAGHPSVNDPNAIRS